MPHWRVSSLYKVNMMDSDNTADTLSSTLSKRVLFRPAFEANTLFDGTQQEKSAALLASSAKLSAPRRLSQSRPRSAWMAAGGLHATILT
jgi:hypothetical protein